MEHSIQIWQIYVNSYLYDYRNDGHCLFCFRNGMTTTWAWCDTTTNLTPSTWSTLVWTRSQRSTTGTRVGTAAYTYFSLTLHGYLYWKRTFPVLKNILMTLNLTFDLFAIVSFRTKKIINCYLKLTIFLSV